ncbi:MAG: MATE family efflux transporter [Eubacterium sp.]|nr:MATE family efflux transporter [Eubacterium sp.]
MNNDRKYYIKRILAIAIPMMLSSLISELQMVIDRAFIGQISIDAMSAVGNASTPIWTTMNIIFSFATGATILASQAYGAGDIDRVKQILASVFKFSNIPAGILCLFWLFLSRPTFTIMGVDASIIDMSIDYARTFAPVFILTGIGASVSAMLQVSQKTKILIAYGVTRSLANVVLDYLLIFGNFGFPEMKVQGAALATALAELLGDLIVLIYVLKSKQLKLRPTFSQIWHAKLRPYLTTIRLGAPAAAEEFAWNLGNLYLLVMLNQISTKAAGIHSIIFSVELVAVALLVAIGSATLTLSGYETGRKNVRGVWSVVSNSSLLAMGISVVNLIVFMLFPSQLLGIFTKDESVLAAAPIYLLIVGIDLFPKAGNILFGSGIKGYGEPSWMLKTQTFGTIFIVGMSSVMVLVFHMGIMEIFMLVVADETIRFIFNAWKLRRVTKSGDGLF